MSKTIKRITFIASIILIAIMVLTIAIASTYSMIVSDDYAHAVAIGVFDAPFFEYLAASFKYVVYAYNNFSGTYFAMFIQALFSPVNNGGLTMLRIVMVVNVLMLFGSLSYLVVVATKKINNEYKAAKSLIICILIFMILGLEIYHQIFYWFSGAASYSFPLSVALLGAAFFIRMNQTFKKRYFILSMICGALAMGGSLSVAGSFCYIILLLSIYYFLKEKKHKKTNYIALGVWILFALINTVAPGNYLRHEMIDTTGVHPLNGLVSAFAMTNTRYNHLFTSTAFVSLLLIIFIVGIIASRNLVESNVASNTNSTLNKPLLIISLLGLLLPFVTAFPITLGYSGEDYQNRCVFIVDFMIYLSATFTAFSLGMIVASLIEKRREFVILVLLLSAVCFAVGNYSIKDNKITPVMTDILSGVYEEHDENYKEFLGFLENAPKGDDVEFSVDDLPYNMDNIYSFYVTNDPSHWTNEAVAKYYGFNSIIEQY